MSQFICCCCNKDILEIGTGFVLRYTNTLEGSKWFWCRNTIELQKWIVRLSKKEVVSMIEAYRVYPTKLKLLPQQRIDKFKRMYERSKDANILSTATTLTPLV